ncbi:hypothetical protein [Streptomyces glomeratus]|uniref:hypothetical protein n=2 Tax=Streptomyces glomeratus TaxID=284452 RepID=UPI001F2EB6F0|nr:hypothetical protein [Streptomyces glomeratus]MCF1510412.1 hypothetical protein [Streptomyces glomeratus]
METADEARTRLAARQRELLAELEQVEQHLAQLDKSVLVSGWWQNPSGPGSRGTAYHTGKDHRCRPGYGAVEMTLYEALRAGLNPCGRCKPPTAPMPALAH